MESFYHPIEHLKDIYIIFPKSLVINLSPFLSFGCVCGWGVGVGGNITDYLL